MAVFFRAALDAGSIGAWVVAVGEAVATATGSDVAAAFLRDFLAGDAEGSALAAGEVSAVVSFFFFDFLPGEADASAVGDSPAAGEASAVAFLRECLAGEAEALGAGD